MTSGQTRSLGALRRVEGRGLLEFSRWESWFSEQLAKSIGISIPLLVLCSGEGRLAAVGGLDDGTGFITL